MLENVAISMVAGGVVTNIVQLLRKKISFKVAVQSTSVVAAVSLVIYFTGRLFV